MEYTQDEILNALRVIKETCEEAGECENCPLRNKEYNDKCYLMETAPLDWKIRANSGTWRAFG